jgi:uncharacterized low-complexity protein
MKKSVITTAVGLASAIAFGAAHAAENPFAMKDLGNGYQVAEKAKDGKCGEGKCGSDKKAKDAKCGSDKKAKDAKCGGDKKAKDAKCGGDKK